MGGYLPQYRWAAARVLNDLEHGLAWIRLADPNAGRTDDLQVGFDLRVDAYQVKWSQYPSPFTFQQLLSESGDTPSLLAQLADGWTRLRASNPGRRVVVHLVTNDIPSVRDRLPESNGARHSHFAAFMEEAWRAGPHHAPQVWQGAWLALHHSSRLDRPEFERFIADCELLFGENLSARGASAKEKARQAPFLDHLTRHFMAVVADPRGTVEVPRAELLAHLGVGSGQFRARHDFPVGAAYVASETTATAFTLALDGLPGGYIVVFGPPGSGKSTFLTAALRGRPERVVRYYAYVPDAHDPVTARGEAVNFLHDMVLALEQAGVPAGTRVRPLEREALLEAWRAQLQYLHEEWRNQGVRTVILIDGLDHIPREQQPQRSLLQDLPMPGELRDGVFLVLGTQTDHLDGLSLRVAAALREPTRRVEVRLLSREEVTRVVEQARLPMALDPVQQHRVFVASGGLPLALSYLLQRLATASTVSDVDAVLDAAGAFEGHIALEYETYWLSLGADEAVRALLGRLCRLRRVVDLEWVETWADRAALRRFVELTWQYFRRETDTRWYFFHNSFRLFLLERTTRRLFGPGQDEALDRALHAELADRCGASESPVWCWEELYHRARAQQGEVVLERVTPAWAREQFFALRPPDAIQTDVLLALREAAVRYSGGALVRCTLILSELQQRVYQLEDMAKFDFADLLLDLNEPQAAAELVRDGGKLRVKRARALDLSVRLLAVGLETEARAVFELAEPFDLFFGHPVALDYPEEPREELQAWARAAPHFRHMVDVIGTIERLRFERSRGWSTSKDPTRGWQARLLFLGGLGALDAGNDGDVTGADAKLYARGDAEEARFWLAVHRWRDAPEVRRRKLVEGAADAFASADLSDIARLTLAEAVLRELGDTARAAALAQGLALPNLDDVLNREDVEQEFHQHLRFYRLLFALGQDDEARSAVPESKRDGQQGLVAYERALNILGRLWADAWCGRNRSGATLFHELQVFFPLFDNFRPRGGDGVASYQVPHQRGAFLEWVVDVAHAHGRAAFDEVRHLMQAQWNAAATRKMWPFQVRRRVARGFFAHGAPRPWVVATLSDVQAEMPRHTEMFGQLEDVAEHVRAWIEVGDLHSARNLLHEAQELSFRVGQRKDVQMTDWVGWLGRHLKVHAEETEEQLTWWARSVASLADLTETGAERRAAQKLIEVAYERGAEHAVVLLEWFVARGTLSFAAGLSALLEAAAQGASGETFALVGAGVRDLLIATSATAQPNAVARYIRRTTELHGRAAAEAATADLQRAMALYALPSELDDWMEGLKDIAAELKLEVLGLDLNASPANVQEHDSRVLRRTSSSLLSLTQVMRRVSTLDDLFDLLGEQAEGCPFEWVPVLRALAPTLGPVEVQHLAEEVRAGRAGLDQSAGSGQSLVFAALSQNLAAAGQAELAWTLGLEALRTSSSSGWARWIDGGTRVEACAALIAADPARGRELTTDALARDIEAQPYLAQTVAQELDVVLPLLETDASIETVWEEINGYVRKLFDRAPLPGDAPVFPAAGLGEDIVLARGLVRLARHPVPLLAFGARRALTRLWSSGHDAVTRALHEGARGGEPAQEVLAMVIEGGARDRTPLLHGWSEELETWAVTDNAALRDSAARLRDRLGLITTMPSQRNLPVEYALVMPVDVAAPTFPVSVRSDDALPDSADPAQTLRPYDETLEYVAVLAGLDKRAVLWRARRLMGELLPEGMWSAQGERELRAALDLAGLRLPFNRPRAVLARRAVFHVVTELLDAGRLDMADWRALRSELRYFDPAFVAREPTPRPEFVAPAPLHVGWDRSRAAWEDAVCGTAAQLPFALVDGRVILAEESRFRLLGQGRPFERRSSRVDRSTLLFEVPGGVQLPRSVLTNAWMDDCASSTAPHADAPLLVEHEGRGFDTAGEGWLALHPALGAQLGWSFDAHGLFRWTDAQGRVMVESLWWQAGGATHTRIASNAALGQGWMVVATASGWAALRSAFSSWRRVTRVERGRESDTGPHAEEAVDQVLSEV